MIGKRIHQLRTELGLSLTELARRAGVAKSYLSNIENDLQKNPSIQFLYKICIVLNIDTHVLLDQEMERKDKNA
jgi:XRE family transcriptional regulator of biofilm formation